MKPFKVVCVKEVRYKRKVGKSSHQVKTSPIKLGKIYTVIYVETYDSMTYYNLAEDKEGWGFNEECFVPVETNYSDATSEILEKFKSPAETPDKILTPEKVKV